MGFESTVTIPLKEYRDLKIISESLSENKSVSLIYGWGSGTLYVSKIEKEGCIEILLKEIAGLHEKLHETKEKLAKKSKRKLF